MTTLDPQTGHRTSPVPTRAGRGRPAMLGLAALLVAHGLAHFVGVVAAFDAYEAGGTLDYLGGTWTIEGGLAIGLVGMLWATLGLAFAFSAFAVVTEFRGWERPLIVLATLSTGLCVLALWAAWIGVIVNAVILTVAVVSRGEPVRRGSTVRP